MEFPEAVWGSNIPKQKSEAHNLENNSLAFAFQISAFNF